MEKSKEYNHIVSCIKDLRKLPTGSDDWWTRVRLLKERARSSWILGRITLEDFNKFTEYFDRIMKQVRELTEKKAAKEKAVK